MNHEPPSDNSLEDHGPQENKTAATGNLVERKFACPQCAAQLTFDPTQQALACPYCGFKNEVQESEPGQVQERDWNSYWEDAGGHKKHDVILGHSSEVSCAACGAVVLLDDRVVTENCTYCGNHLENKPQKASEMIVPEGVLPFKVDDRQAAANFQKWLNSLWFAPSALKKFAYRGQLRGIYIPYWTYDSETDTHYTGQRGDNYQVTETYTEPESYTETINGQQVSRTRMVTKTRVVTKIRWTWVSGDVEAFFNDVLVCASHSLPPKLIERLEPWDLDAVEPFRAEFLSGFQTERYTLGLKEGFEIAKVIMDGKIRQLCCRDIGGDHQQLSSVDTGYSGITFKHQLHPVWIATYRFREKLYQILVNARTGEVVGTRPWSVTKIVVTILVSVVVVGAIIGLVKWFQSF